MKEINLLLKENKVDVLCYLITGLVIAFLTNYKVKFFQQVIDDFSNQKLMLVTIIAYGVILIAFYFMNYIDEYPAKRLENNLYFGFKVMALEKVSRLYYRDYVKLGTGKLTQSIENGAEAGKCILFDFWLNLFRQLLPTILFSIFFIWKINPLIGAILLVGYGVVFIITHLLLKVLYEIKEKILVNEELLNHYLVRGFMEMTVFRLERRFVREMSKASKAKDEIVQAKVKMNMIHEAFFALFALLIALLNIGILIYAWYSKALSIGETVALMALVENAYTPIAIFNVLFVQYKLDLETFRRFGNLLKCEEDLQLEQGEDVIGFRGKIVVEKLEFKYDDNTVFEDLNLVIQAGQKVAFVGDSGSGKTTLVKLILGLLKYSMGSIRIDNQELKKVNLNHFYKYVSYIAQDSPIFEGTLKENIVFDQEVEDDKIIEVLKKVKLNQLIETMPGGLYTRVGERGITLSGGERQRLALARLWFQIDNLVILDEATAALDNLMEESVMNELLELLERKTVLAVAHRLNSIKDFDKIVVFREGKIVEQGTFKELLNYKSYFKALYDKSIS